MNELNLLSKQLQAVEKQLCQGDEGEISDNHDVLTPQATHCDFYNWTML